MWGQCDMCSLHNGSVSGGVGKSMSSCQPAGEEFKFACVLAVLTIEESKGLMK